MEALRQIEQLESNILAPLIPFLFRCVSVLPADKTAVTFEPQAVQRTIGLN